MINITKTIKNHLKENSGDENISKMTWVAIIFLVGTTLFLFITAAFKGSVQNWYNDSVVVWFSGERGHHSYK